MLKNIIKKLIAYVFRPEYKFAKRGDKCFIGSNCIINSASMIELGNHVSIGPNAVLYCIYKKIIFGNNVLLGPNVTMVNGDHNMRKIGVPIIDNNEKEASDDADIIIEDDVWIGANVTILKGVTVGRGAVIAAGAVVTRSIPPYCVSGGIPAHVLNIRFTIEQVKQHEGILYSEKDRMKDGQLQHLASFATK
ncbi:acyltransferase [Bacteroides xylanisolvens]|uniref:acyltransferase n=1 Tax=Bacteroides xylanisolvens TaxID=371601 RepID=UPI0026D97C7C|nr:acyltransferase [Bacteroides xylanisolvens]